MEQEYLEKSGQIRQLAAMPLEEFAGHLSGLHNTLDDAAPNVSPHIYATANNAVQYLNSKLPQVGQNLLQDKNNIPSQTQRNNWLDLHGIVSDPTKILDGINSGTVTNSHIEAIKSVYPDLHQEMSMKLLEGLGKAKNENKTLPYKKRIAISKFLGTPVDSTLSQQNMQSIILSASNNPGRQPPQAKAGGEKKSKGSGWLAEADKVTKLYETPDQAREIEKKGK